MEVDHIGVCVSHCCRSCGYCKYGKEDCPVLLGTHQQNGPCEDCTAWTLDWPTIGGNYWFYGYKWHGAAKYESAALYMVRTRKAVNNESLICIIDGDWMVKEDGPRGWFLPLNSPNLPAMPIPEPK